MAISNAKLGGFMKLHFKVEFTVGNITVIEVI